MRVEMVDERDSGWEDQAARFRVYLFSTQPRPGSVVWTYDISGADALEVIRWAQNEAGADRLYAVALVVDDETRGRGVVWLVGMDINGEPHSDLERARRAAVFRRRGAHLVQNEPDPR